MINLIWLVMILAGIILAGITGQPEIVTQAAFEAAQTAVKYAFELIGIMSLWLGLMKVAEEAGIIKAFAQLLRPFTKYLFPSVPQEHPAMGFILMNFSANLLGLGNAATPFGLKAMQELQNLNLNKNTASEAMCTLLAMNTSCITLLPATVIGIRIAAGSTNPTEIVSTTLFATTVGMTVALLTDYLMRQYYRRKTFH